MLAALLLTALDVRAQSIVDARRVEFTPSPQHNALTTTGAPVVERYTIEVFVAGGVWPVSGADLGKPSPGTDGMIRLDFVSLLTTPLATGVTYEAVVEAVGPGGRSGGTRTNTFSFGGVPCTPAVSPLSASFSAAGGSGGSAVTAGSGCVWNATSNVSWITVTSNASGSGSANVSFSVAENPSTSGRTGTLTIAGATFTVTQAGVVCTYSISPSSQSFTAAGGSGASTVAAGSGCAWTAASNASWVTVTGGASGSGGGVVGFSVAANTATTARSATLTIAGKTFTVTQANAACSYSIAPTSQSFAAAGGTGSSAVTAGSGCAWSATSNAAWVTVTNGGTGSGSGGVGFSVAANTSTLARTGTLTIAGSTFTIDQAGATCSHSVSPKNQNFAGGGGTGVSTVTTGQGCAWRATSNASWITVIEGSSGTGSGSTAFTIEPNTGDTVRTGTLTIADATVTITQTSPSVCTPTLSSTSSWHTADGGFGTSTVTAEAACEWDAVSNVAWVAVINPGPGKGSGTVSFIVASYTGSATRVGTLTIAGKTYTVTQSGAGCSFTISPSSQGFSGAGGTGSSAVTTASTCPWAATSDATWITITAGANGTGSGTVAFTVAPNPGTTSRTGRLLIAGTSFTVTQAAPVLCTATMTPTSRSFTSDGGFGSSAVTADATCAWTAESNTSWIAVLNAGPGRGNGTVTFVVATNTSGASRTGSLTIAGNTFTVTQTATAACTYTVSSETVTVASTGGTTTLTVTTQGGCAWSSSGAPTWMTLTGSGSGNGTATIVVPANTTTASRTATVTIAGRSVTVTQKGKLTAPTNLRIIR
ncbi:MAG TPA: BACON domain-containing carbohydrate-binding protein [Vicinamibacterales bacterium]|nr:BACON domain-containing carbohydrate-binding protein [Vicinamibacterales bacterium]